jgi:2-polyprenyl-3-methyl-5-hydroxy-6-metoxy-1,4-benzoquinol methylase
MRLRFFQRSIAKKANLLPGPAPSSKTSPVTPTPYQQTISDRFTVIEKYVRPPSEVLDLGCVDARRDRHSARERIEHKPDLLFRRIVEANRATVGIDIDAEGVAALRQGGFNVLAADVETMDLSRRFDAIMAGEIIEHLESPGLFLRNMRRHLKPGGTLIISTPNPFYQGQVWKIWRYGRPAVHSEHTNWQDPSTLHELLRRTGFTAFDGYWVQPSRGLFKSWKRHIRAYFAHGFLTLARPDGAGD